MYVYIKDYPMEIGFFKNSPCFNTDVLSLKNLCTYLTIFVNQ